jgi:hypothetical protein
MKQHAEVSSPLFLESQNQKRVHEAKYRQVDIKGSRGLESLDHNSSMEMDSVANSNGTKSEPKRSGDYSSYSRQRLSNISYNTNGACYLILTDTFNSRSGNWWSPKVLLFLDKTLRKLWALLIPCPSTF